MEFEVPGQFVFYVHWSTVTDLTEPSKVLALWEKVMIRANKFNGWEDGLRPRPERAVFDRQITVGNDDFGHVDCPCFAFEALDYDMVKMIQTTRQRYVQN